MANYKVDITKRLGVFHAAFYEASPGAAAPPLDKQPPLKAMEDVLSLCATRILAKSGMRML